MAVTKAPSVEVDTRLGKISCEVCEDPNYPGLTVYWGGRQIAVIEPATEGSIMRIMAWDKDEDDPSDVLPIFPGYGE